MRTAIQSRIARRHASQLSVAAFVVALAGCCPLARFFMAVHMKVMVQHADGTPARGVALWYVDRELVSSEHSVGHQEELACKTDDTGGCTATLTYYYCKSVCPWDAPSEPVALGRFEILTRHNGKKRTLGFLQGVTRRGAFLEGRLSARIE